MALKAKIFCDKDKGNPLFNHYRPVFDFEGTYLGGEIFLEGAEKILQGDEGLAQIKFFRPDLLEGKLEFNKKIFFYETLSRPPMGYCVFLED